MNWMRATRRKQGWAEQTLSSISAPPVPLVAVLAIVIFLLSLSQYSAYKEQMRYTMFSFKILLFVAPVFVIVFLRSSLLSSGVWLNFCPSSQQAFPWGVALLLLALLLLLSYHSSFYSKCFPFGTSD
ncbi:hypothetical protein C2S51_025692 [Perilla frutescens var. frutescens]|nr:hypothetical protein C2S51_025692 [Perilla frutescens var. frutescens]